MLTEFVDYRKSHPNCSANDARDALSGKTDIDKFEYGYASTLLVMSDMILSKLKQENIESACNLNIPRSCQIIYYGAPGTGKSHAINTHTSTKSVIRTTFHPDSDYSTFVGAYKPTTEEQTRYNDSGVPVIYHDGDHKGEPIKDKVIVYDFVEQAFLKLMRKHGRSSLPIRKPLRMSTLSSRRLTGVTVRRYLATCSSCLTVTNMDIQSTRLLRIMTSANT